MKTFEQIMDLVDDYVYKVDSYEHSQTCSPDTYKRQEQEMYTARARLEAEIQNLFERLKCET